MLWPTEKIGFGDKDKIHIDGYAVINWADGFEIELRKNPQQVNIAFILLM